MKKIIFLLFALVLFINVNSQEKYLTKTGHIWFLSNTPLEKIEAHNKAVVSLLNLTTGDIEFVLLMKSFKFDNALMEEHFNENYVQSDQFPKATFKGKITNLSSIQLESGQPQQVTIEGNLTIHGKTNTVKTNGTLAKSGDKIDGKSKFNLSPSDYDMKVEKYLEEKIAKTVEVNIELSYDKQK